MGVSSVRGAGDPPVCGVLAKAEASRKARDGSIFDGALSEADLGQAATLYNAENPGNPYTGNLSDLHDNMQIFGSPFLLGGVSGALFSGSSTTKTEIQTMQNALGCPTDK